ncbi:aminotransferase class I/II-fold pyridoxal phosphate-dependent enzyme [Oceanihabitans sp.]|nr:aminotransferase class I/II-fold pyridoxal phosphate-dependent enzyme [Oceanihabitans sp.]
MEKININIKQLKPSSTLAINQKVHQLKSEGKIVYHFGFGQSPFNIHKSIVKALKKNASNNNYLPTLGLLKLRKTIALFLQEYQQITIDSEFIFIGPGSKELLYQTILILNGTFLIPKGSWVSYGPQIESKGGKYNILETYLKDNFKLTASVLERYCQINRDDQKILILNSPNNPTGAVYTQLELEALSVVCRTYNLIVISDEIYSQINFSSPYSPSIFSFYPEKTIVFGGLSKVFSAGGYRLGFMGLPEGLKYLHNTYKSLFSETFSAVSSPIQYAAIEAYKMPLKLKKDIEINTAILAEISKYIYTKLSLNNVLCTEPQGAFYMMIGFYNYKNQINKLGIYDSQKLATYLLEKFQVALLPANDFYFNNDELFFRMAFVDFNGNKIKQHFKENPTINEVFLKKYCPNILNGIERILQFLKVLTN